MRVLITGFTGFAGGHLAEALLAEGGPEVFGLSRSEKWPAELAHLAPSVSLRPCDLNCDPSNLAALLAEIRPSQVYHLAGYAHAGDSYRDVEACWNGNLTATRALYEAVHCWGGKPKILFVGSGMVYGDVSNTDATGSYTPPAKAPDEGWPLRPTSPYAASKAAADVASYQYTCFPGIDVVRARPFNHFGPRQSARYVVAHFARQIADIEKGKQAPVLETGNLSPLRDLTDVRDVVRAYVLLMERGRTGEAYNIARGEIVSIKTVLDGLLRLSRVPVAVRQQSDLVRRTETLVVQGDAGKLRHETGWAPRFSLEQSLSDTLEYWRSQP